MEKTVIEYFINLVQIDSEARFEKATSEKLSRDLVELGAEVKFDNANEKTGGNVGNLYAYFPGKIDKKPILFCAHMDTVKPGNGIKPQIKDDKIITDGSTILGSDDKSGIAEIIWAIKELRETGEETAPVEVLFTISEEIGLLGAKYLDYTMIKSETGYALDTHKVGEISIAAPAANRIKYIVRGKKAHAGAAPEKGINAIRIASEAIAVMPMGRIDAETTCNVGSISGGDATNIVPNEVIIKAEVRSHNPQKLNEITNQMNSALQDAAAKYEVDNFKASVEIDLNHEYQSFRLSEDDEVVQLAKKASENLGLPYKGEISGGGSDVNVFNQNGLKMAVAGTGMDKVHTVDECIEISDLENGVKWVKEIIRLHSKK